MIIKEIAISFDNVISQYLAFQYLVENNGDFLTKWTYSWIWLKISAIFEPNLQAQRDVGESVLELPFYSLRAVQVRGFSVVFAGTWTSRVPQTPFYGLRPIQVQGFSEKNAGTWTQSKRRLREITRAMAHFRAVRGTFHRLRFEKMDYSPRAAASADSGTALDGEAGRRNGLRSQQSLPGRDRQQIKKEGDYQSEDFLVPSFSDVSELLRSVSDSRGLGIPSE